MLDLDTRTAILRLRREGHGARTIARTLGVSRNAVREVIRSGSAEVPPLERPERLKEHLERVRDLYARCQGNLVRVAEELERVGVSVAYSTLTSFCRRYGIGVKPKDISGRYDFAPGEEMQHDTSPHTVEIAGRMRKVQCASLVLWYSRVLYVQAYPRFTRFECRAFLTEGIQYFGGAAERCMVDNTSVIVGHGTGADMEPAPVMAELGKRFGFAFVAHEKGDANRSAVVERNFHFVETNAYPGRSFESFADLNAQLREWCERINRRPRRLWGQTKAIPMELFAAERAVLTPLPLHVPEVYDLHSRRVDVEAYVSLHTNRYSVPAELIGRRLEVRETLERVRFFDGHRLVADHARIEPGLGKRVTLPEHRVSRARKPPPTPSEEERTLRAAAPALGELVDRLRKRDGGRALRAVRHLHRMYLDYPTPILVAATEEALSFGLIEVARIERMTLARIRGDFFRLEQIEPDDDEDDDDG